MGNTNKRKKVLLVRFSSIGDIVLTSPIVRCVKRQLDCELHFITKSKFRAVIEHNLHVDKVYTIDREITEVIGNLKSEKYDLIIDLHKNLRSKRLILSLGVSSYSFDKINLEKWLRVHLRVNYLPNKHLVDRYFERLTKIGVTNDGEGLSYYHGLTEYDIADLIPNEKYMVIVLGATFYTKRIPKDKIEILIQNSNYRCVLLGGSDVVELGNLLEKQYSNVLNLAGKCTLNESAALVQNSIYVATGDTGLMHMAAGFKVPTLVFWGSTAHELGMYPYYGSNHNVKSINLINRNITCSPCSKIGKEKCPKGHFKCMLDLKADEIINGMKLLEVIAK